MTLGKPPLVFVYLGGVIPDYATASLRFAQKHSGLATVLVTDVSFPPRLPGLRTVSLDGWYSRRLFEQFVHQSTLDPFFRGGFWLHAVERFFVLDQFLKEFEYEACFHAELDNMVFRLDDLESVLNAEKKGVHIPIDKSGRGYGSLVYVNDPSSLTELTTYMVKHADLGNEMDMLGAFSRDNPGMVNNLLPPEDALRQEKPLNPADSGMSLSVDAAAAGQWFFGIDPRNTSKIVWNRWARKEDLSALKRLRTSFRESDGTLWAKGNQGPWEYRLANLHIHSKIVRRLSLPGVLRLYLWFSRFPFRIPVVIPPRFASQVILEWLLKPQRIRLARQPGLRTVGVRLLVTLARRQSKPLSNRQRKAFIGLFPANPLAGSSCARLKVSLVEVTKQNDVEVVKLFGADQVIATQQLVAHRDEQPGHGKPRHERVMSIDTTSAQPLMCDSIGELASWMSGSGSDIIVVRDSTGATDLSIPLDKRGRQLLWPDFTKNDRQTHVTTRDTTDSTFEYFVHPQVVQPKLLQEMFEERETLLAGLEELSAPDALRELVNEYASWLVHRHPKKAIWARRESREKRSAPSGWADCWN